MCRRVQSWAIEAVPLSPALVVTSMIILARNQRATNLQTEATRWLAFGTFVPDLNALEGQNGRNNAQRRAASQDFHLERVIPLPAKIADFAMRPPRRFCCLMLRLFLCQRLTCR